MEISKTQEFFIKRRNYGLIEIIFNYLEFEDKIKLYNLNKNVKNAILTTIKYIKFWKFFKNEIKEIFRFKYENDNNDMSSFDNNYSLEKLLNNDSHKFIELLNSIFNKKKFSYYSIKNIEDGDYIRKFIGILINKIYFESKYINYLNFLKLEKLEKSFIFQHEKSIFTLNLSNSNLMIDSIKILSSIIETNKFLKHIDLSSNEFGDEGVNLIFKSIKNNLFLNDLEIELFDNNVTDTGAEYIYENLLKRNINNNIKNRLYISLWNNKISENGLKFLIELIKKKYSRNNLNKIEFNLQKNNLEDSAIKLFFENSENLKTLNNFDLSYNKIKSDGLENLKYFKNSNLIFLDTLNLSNNQIQNEGIFYISNSLGKSLFIKNLILKENEITMEGVRYLSNILIKIFRKEKNLEDLKQSVNLNDILENNYEINTIDLSCNNIGKGVIYIANYLEYNFKNSLSNLNLSSCSIGPIELVYLAKAIKKNTYLTKIDLSNNNFMEEGLKEFLIELNSNDKINYNNNYYNEETFNFSFINSFNNYFKPKSNSPTNYIKINKLCSFRLEEINLSHNKLNDGSAEDISSFLKINNSIKKLILTYSQFTDKGIIQIMSAFKYNKSLLSLNLSDGNKFSINSVFKPLLKIESLCLKELYLSHCNFQFYNNSDEFINFLKNNTNNNNLSILDLSYNYLTDYHFGIILNNILESNKNFEVINFSSNNITDNGLNHLIEYLCLKGKINHIKLNRNKITNFGYFNLTKIFKNKQNIQNYENNNKIPIINLKDNKINITNNNIVNSKYINIIL